MGLKEFEPTGTHLVFLQATPLSDNAFTKYSHFINYQKLGIGFLEIVSNIIESGRKGVRIKLYLSPPNQSLKLTEPAVDDLTRAKQPVTIARDIPRADKTVAAALRGRRLAPVRLGICLPAVSKCPTLK